MGIRDQSYQRYDGAADISRQWWTIGWHDFRTMLRFKRTKLTLVLIWLMPLLFGLLIIAEAAVLNGDPSTLPDSTHATALIAFLQLQFGALALLYMARGCHLISDDQRYQTLSLIFSRPLTVTDYGLGKLCALLLMAAMAILVPSALLLILRSAVYIHAGGLSTVLMPQLGAFAILALICVVAASLVLLISSMTRRSGLAVLIWLTILLIPMIVQVILNYATGGAEWTNLASLQGLILNSVEAIYPMPDSAHSSLPRFSGLIALVATAFVALTLFHRRLLQLRHLS